MKNSPNTDDEEKDRHMWFEMVHASCFLTHVSVSLRSVRATSKRCRVRHIITHTFILAASRKAAFTYTIIYDSKRAKKTLLAICEQNRVTSAQRNQHSHSAEPSARTPMSSNIASNSIGTWNKPAIVRSCNLPIWSLAAYQCLVVATKPGGVLKTVWIFNAPPPFNCGFALHTTQSLGERRHRK